MKTEKGPYMWTAEQIAAYHSGKLPTSLKHAIEADALEDPFLAESLEGTEGVDLIEEMKDLDDRWAHEEVKSNSSNGRERGLWRGLVLGGLVSVTIYGVWLFWNGQKEIADLHHAVIAEKAENEEILIQYADSLRLLEINLAKVIPEEDQIDAEQTIADQKIQTELESKEQGSDQRGVVEHMDTLEKLSPGPIEFSTPDGIKVKAFPVIYVRDLKVADYRVEREGATFALPGLLTGTPAAREKRAVDDKGSTMSLSYDHFLEMAIGAFEEREYKDALVMLERLSDRYPRDENAMFYKGLCYYNLGRYDKAGAFFGQAQWHENAVFNEEAEFYRALSKLNDGKEKEAKRLLQIIVSKNSFYANRAGQYLLD